jgi:hypothetical protein
MENTDRTGVEALIAEFDEEMANTRRMLERVPDSIGNHTRRRRLWQGL